MDPRHVRSGVSPPSSGVSLGGTRFTRPTLRRIIAAGIPGIAAADAPDSAPHAADRAILLHGPNEIGAARRLKTAASSQDRAERILVDPRHPDQDPRRNAEDRPEDRGQEVALHGPDLSPCSQSFCQIFLAALRANLTSDSCKPAVSGTASGRGITIKSSPAGNCSRDKRNASRMQRFQRLRTTAPPTLRETESPSRGCARSLG